MRLSKREGNWTNVLCTQSEDYTDTGLHYHDILSAHEMYHYVIMSGNTADSHKITVGIWWRWREQHLPESNKITVAGRWDWEEQWLPGIRDWELEGSYIAYNISDYIVAKQR